MKHRLIDFHGARVQLNLNLIKMYGKCGYVHKAAALFEELRVQRPAL